MAPYLLVSTPTSTTLPDLACAAATFGRADSGPSALCASAELVHPRCRRWLTRSGSGAGYGREGKHDEPH